MDDSTNATIAETVDSGIPPNEREELEREKLRLEIRNLNRSTWFQPGTVIPLVATLVTLGLSWVYGVFDVRRDRIQVESDRLEVRRLQLTEQVSGLNSNRDALQKRIEDLNKIVEDKERHIGDEGRELSHVKNVLAKPILQIDSAIDEPDNVAIALHNTGQGTADVQVMRAFVSGNRIQQGTPPKTGEPIVEALNLNDSVYWDWYMGKVAAKQSIPLWYIKPKDASPENVRAFKNAIPKLGIEVCYCSLLDSENSAKQCYWATFNRPEIKSSSCK